jgi:membrane protein YqaA with SNARE-associated domain
MLRRESSREGVNKLLRRLYDWTLSLAASPHAIRALAMVSFVESSVFPIPPDLLLIPMVIAAPHRAFWIATVCTLASVAGGAFGYLIGWGLFEQVGRPVLAFYGKDVYFGEFAARYNEWGAWAVLIGGLTPFPYKVNTILSGTTGLNFAVFMVASLIARGLRFYIVAALLWKFGPPIREFVEKRLALVFTVFLVVLAGGFVVAGYLA